MKPQALPALGASRQKGCQNLRQRDAAPAYCWQSRLATTLKGISTNTGSDDTVSLLWGCREFSAEIYQLHEKIG